MGFLVMAFHRCLWDFGWDFLRLFLQFFFLLGFFIVSFKLLKCEDDLNEHFN